MKYFIICAIGIIIQLFYIKADRDKKYLSAVILKGTASLIFVALGFICSLKSSNSRFATMIISGLISGMIGDIFLNIRYLFKDYEFMFF